MKIITGTFKDGGVEVETTGFQGKACLEETTALKEALGEVESTTAKPEMALNPVGQANQQKQGGK